MVAGGQVPGGEHVVHRPCHRGVGQGRGGGGGVGDQVRDRRAAGFGVVAGRVAAGFAEMDLVPAPAPAAFLGVPDVGVVGGLDEQMAGREPLAAGFPPDHLLPVRTDLAVVLLHPDRPQCLHRGQLAQPRRRAGRADRVQQPVPVLAVPHGQRVPGGLGRGQPQLLDPLPVHPLPRLVDHGGQPVRRGRRERLQNRPHRLPGQLQPVQHPDPPDHVRRVGALPGAGLHQAQLPAPLQQPVQHHQLQAPRHQPPPELAQHAEIKPLILQFQAQAVLPVQPPPHRVRRLPVRQVLRELQHRHHRQLRGEIPGRPRTPYTAPKSASSYQQPSSSRTRIASVPFRNAARATRAVPAGTSGHGPGRIDITTRFRGREQGQETATPTAARSSTTPALPPPKQPGVSPKINQQDHQYANRRPNPNMNRAIHADAGGDLRGHSWTLALADASAPITIGSSAARPYRSL